jgi:hypothetical protein
MTNLRAFLPLVNGHEYVLEFQSGKELIDAISDDWGVPPRLLILEASTPSGQRVRISIPYDEESAASAVIVEGE